MTVRTIIVSAFNELQLYAPGEDIANVDIAKGFQSLNIMLDSWSNESLSTFCILEQSILLTPPTALYTIGPGGTGIDTSKGGQRPLRIIEGPGAAYIQDTNYNNYNVDVITRAEWNMIGNRTINSNIPNCIFYDPQFPLGQLNVFPEPNIGYTLFFDSYSQLARMPSIDVDIDLPPGYEKALQHNLAIELSSSYPIAKLSAQTVALAREAKANIKRTNSKILLSVYDPELITKATGSYNIYSDSYNATGR